MLWQIMMLQQITGYRPGRILRTPARNAEKKAAREYTKNGNVYTLEDFGSITVVKKGNTVVDLEMKAEDGETYTFSAQIVE